MKKILSFLFPFGFVGLTCLVIAVYLTVLEVDLQLNAKYSKGDVMLTYKNWAGSPSSTSTPYVSIRFLDDNNKEIIFKEGLSYNGISRIEEPVDVIYHKNDSSRASIVGFTFQALDKLFLTGIGLFFVIIQMVMGNNKRN